MLGLLAASWGPRHLVFTGSGAPLPRGSQQGVCSLKLPLFLGSVPKSLKIISHRPRGPLGSQAEKTSSLSKGNLFGKEKKKETKTRSWQLSARTSVFPTDSVSGLDPETLASEPAPPEPLFCLTEERSDSGPFSPGYGEGRGPGTQKHTAASLLGSSLLR